MESDDSVAGERRPEGDEFSLGRWPRVVCVVSGLVSFTIGSAGLLWRELDGLASASALIIGALLGLMALTGQVPATPWARFRQAEHELRRMTARASQEDAMRSVLQSASSLGAWVGFHTRIQAMLWDATVSTDERAVGVTYMDAALSDEDELAIRLLHPSGPEDGVLLVCADGVAPDDVAHILGQTAQRLGLEWQFQGHPEPGSHSRAIAICRSALPEIHDHLDALFHDEWGGTGQPLRFVHTVTEPGKSDL